MTLLSNSRPGPRYAVGLYRVSTAEQGYSGLGLEAQQTSVRAFIAAQGWKVVAEYSDIASGKDDRRPGYRRNFPDARVAEARLNQRSDPSLLGPVGRVDLNLASPECTNHTHARGARERDEASQATAFHVLRFIRELEPRWAVIENVEQMRKWGRYERFLAALRRHMNVAEHVFDAQHFGVPQMRRRLFLICSRDGQPRAPVPAILQHPVPVRQILAPRGTYNTRPLFGSGLAGATVARAERAIGALGRGVPFLIVYYGSDGSGGWQPLDRPIRTLTTLDRFALAEWYDGEPRMRMLQVDELKRAMGFDEGFVLNQGSRRDRIKLLGNGVCPPVMRMVVESLIDGTKTVGRPAPRRAVASRAGQDSRPSSVVAA